MLTTATDRRLTSYDLMRCFFATLAKKNHTIINKENIVRAVYDFKENMLLEDSENARMLFGNIEFREGIDENVVSYDISEGINNLQTFGVVGRLNPTYEKLVIYLTEKEADEVLSRYGSNVQMAIESLVDSFVGD